MNKCAVHPDLQSNNKNGTQIAGIDETQRAQNVNASGHIFNSRCKEQYCGTLCQLNCTVLRTVACRGLISYENSHFRQNSRPISFTCPILVRPNLHLPLLHQDLTHLTWQIHGHQTHITTQIIKLSHQERPGLIGCLFRLLCCYFTA